MKPKIFLFLVFVGFILIPPMFVLAQGKNPEVLKALENLEKSLGNTFEIEWRGDRVIRLVGALSSPYSGTPEEAAKKFLKENAAIFQMSPDTDVEIEDVTEIMGSYQIGFRQTFKTLPVFNGGLGVVLKEDKSVYLVGGNYLPSISIATDPALSEKEIIEIAKDRFLNVDCHRRADKVGKLIPCDIVEVVEIELDESPQVQLGIFEYQGKPRLAYRIFMAVKSPSAALQYFIDGNTGTVLEGGDMTQT